jgi:hypothetical protein
MKKWTAKQERFARLVALEGKNYTEAYRLIAKNKDKTPSIAWRKASEWGKVCKERIEQLKEEVSERLKYDAEAHFRELERMKELALIPQGEYGNIDVRTGLKAVELKGKMTGKYNEKLEVSGNNEPISIVIKVGE